MSGTIHTDGYLTGSEFQDGQSAIISASRIRDIVASKVNVMDVYDDYNNASGLSAPAILAGTTYGHKASGLIVGAGQTLSVRQANATALQAAITYAATNGKFFELIPNTYEISSSVGLKIPQVPTTSGFVWRGSQYSNIVQYYATTPGAPILTVGDATGAAYSYNIDIDGLNVQYGASQTGFTSAINLLLASLTACKIQRVSAGAAAGANPGYHGVAMTAGASAPFSNTLADFRISGAQQDMLHIPTLGTGNLFDNFYMNNGSNALAGNFINCTTSGGEQNFNQINCESATVSTIMNLQSVFGVKFDHIHCENLTITGYGPNLFTFANAMIDIEQIDMVTVIMTTAGGITGGNVSIFSDYGPNASVVKVRNLNLTYNGSGQVNIPISLYAIGSLPSDGVSVFTLEGAVFRDVGGGNLVGRLSLDSHMPVSSGAFAAPTMLNRYDYGKFGSTVSKAVRQVSTTYTHYGQDVDCSIQVPASITSFTLTLAATMGASGTQLPATGNRVNVRRMSGTASGTLTINNDAATLLNTNTTSATEYNYVFNGTHYVAFTAVT